MRGRLAAVVLVTAAGCSRPTGGATTTTTTATATPTPTPTATSAPTTTSTAAPRGTSITLGGGGVTVTGGPSMHGASVACAAFHACCVGHAGTKTPPGMACDLAPLMSGGDCTRAVTIVRDSFAAQGTPAPAGCVVLGDLSGGTKSPGSPRVLIGAP